MDDMKPQLSDGEEAPSGSAYSAANTKKSMTFRQRRLSIPMQHVSPATANKNLENEKQVPSGSSGAQSNALSEKERTMPHSHSKSVPNPGNDDDVDEVHPDEEDYGYETHEPDSASFVGGSKSHDDYDNAAGADSFGGDYPNQQVMIEIDNHSIHSQQSIHSSHASEADEKAHTFRKRKLSMATTNSGSSASIVKSRGKGNTNTHIQVVAPDQFSDISWKRQRRLSHDSSICSANSINSEHALNLASTKRSIGNKPIRFNTRTMHADEILPQRNIPPESPSEHSNNTLYRQQQQQLLVQQSGSSGKSPQKLMLAASNALVPPGFLPQQPQPRWKRRKTICHQTDADKLPFSLDIVGTYSCHGVEPVYDSEFEEDDDELHTAGLPLLTMVAKINQDRGGVAYPYGNHPRTALFAVYDGHGQGGELISQFALYEIQRRLESHPQFETNLSLALKETFLSVDAALNDEHLIDPLFAGTTACIAVYRDMTLTLANAGDSRAVLGRKVQRGNRNRLQSPRTTQQVLAVDNRSGVRDYEYIAIDLTHDQNPDVPLEMERILKMGGYVSLPPQPGLSARVWLDPLCSQIGLAMARSIGDHAISLAGVIAEPVVTTHDVVPEDEFMILASDGVWEFITSFQAVRIVAENLSRGYGATKACQALIEAATIRWHEEEGAYRDDITAIVVQLKQTWTVPTPTDLHDKNGQHSVAIPAVTK